MKLIFLFDYEFFDHSGFKNDSNEILFLIIIIIRIIDIIILFTIYYHIKFISLNKSAINSQFICCNPASSIKLFTKRAFISSFIDLRLIF